MLRVITTVLVLILAAAPSLAGSRVFVVSKEKRALEVYDAQSGALQFAVVAPGEPHEVVLSHDGRLAYVADFEGRNNTLSVVDVEKRAIVQSIDMTPSYRPHGMALSRDGSKLYVTCEASKAVCEVDLHANQVARTFNVTEHTVHWLALSPDNKTVFASSRLGGNVSVIDLTTGERQRSVLSGKGCEGIAVSPDGSELWAANRRGQSVAVIDVAQFKRVETISCVGNPIRVYFTPDGGAVLATCAVAGRLTVFDRARRVETGRIPVGDSPIGLAFEKSGAHAYVTNALGNEVAVVDMNSRAVVRRFPVGADPEGIALLE
jgi:YVTN family beta-propeller protein